MNPDREWFAEAACRPYETDTFFARYGEDPETITDTARWLCAGCPVAEACLEYALIHRVEGTWAGTTFNGRRRLRRDRGIVARSVNLGHLTPANRITS